MSPSPSQETVESLVVIRDCRKTQSSPSLRACSREADHGLKFCDHGPFPFTRALVSALSGAFKGKCVRDSVLPPEMVVENTRSRRDESLAVNGVFRGKRVLGVLLGIAQRWSCSVFSILESRLNVYPSINRTYLAPRKPLAHAHVQGAQRAPSHTGQSQRPQPSGHTRVHHLSSPSSTPSHAFETAVVPILSVDVTFRDLLRKFTLALARLGRLPQFLPMLIHRVPHTHHAFIPHAQ